MVGLTLIAGACHRSMPGSTQHECRATGQSQTGAVPLDTLMNLAGKYTLTTVATSAGTDQWTARAELTLRLADTLERYYERWLNRLVRTGNRPLVGQLVWHRSDGTLRRETVVVQQNPGNTQLIRGFCTNCTDAMLVYHRILQANSHAFSGAWHDPQTGIGRVVDKNGRPLPDPEGYFCARRITMNSQSRAGVIADAKLRNVLASAGHDPNSERREDTSTA
jgi:hypothetical protein